MKRARPAAAREPDETVRAALTAEWDVKGIDLATFALDAKGTIVPLSRRVAPGNPLATLPPLTTEGEGGSVDVKLGDTLGEGGMGVVWAARQPPLRREVAVKSLLPNMKGEEAVAQLLREARITGSLEHPNIVPIHALGRDERGRPLIVMKRIEGTGWDELLDRHHAQGQGEVMRQLERHLAILIDVAKAASFAHARGIVHRDIKPSNVMIGSVGEVYLVDWGIAVTVRDDDGGLDLTHAQDVSDVVGSPAYMAPEMAVGDGPHIDERTDVYLLGATLHEVLTGLPPHDGATPVAMLTHAYASTPQSYDPSIPLGLVDICHKAMQRDPDARFETAAQLTAALREFLEHRHSSTLAEEASAKLETVRELVESVGGSLDRRKRELNQVFDECRFGFRSALTIWPENEVAQRQLQAALEVMIDYELNHGSFEVAATLLDELPVRAAKLEERVQRKRSEAASAREELGQLKREVDPTVADRQRSRLAFVTAATWALLHGGLWQLGERSAYAVGHLELAALYGLYLVGSLATGIAFRETLFARNAAGLKMHLLGLLTFAAWAGSWLVARAVQMDMASGYLVNFVIGCAMWSVGTVAIDRRLAAWTVCMGAGLAAALLWPERALLWMGISGSLAALTLGILRAMTRTAEQAAPLSERWAAEQVSELMATLRDPNLD